MILNSSEHEIISKALRGKSLEKDEIIALLSIDNKASMEELLSAARTVRERTFSNRVFLYGFVYFSTWCRNECNFCYFRKSNDIERYRKEPAEIIDIAQRLADSGVHLIDLTMGEDLQYHQEQFESVLDIVKQIKETTGLPVMISPGVIENSLIEKFAAIGTEWYALYQETHNRELFKKLRINQSYDDRMNGKLYAKEKGMMVEEGILAGVGETIEDIADSIIEMGRIDANQVRVMSFIPQQGSPMEHVKTPGRELELRIIAVLRLIYPKALIPASLDVDGIGGLKVRMNAGANLITSIIPPQLGLMGVAQSCKDVDEGGRTVDEATHILEEIGLVPATAEEYRRYIAK